VSLTGSSMKSLKNCSASFFSWLGFVPLSFPSSFSLVLNSPACFRTLSSFHVSGGMDADGAIINGSRVDILERSGDCSV
jgi:hypothetical protein